MFKDSTKLKEYLEDYDDDYANILIKETYDLAPEITYPCIDIDEINNTSIADLKDDSGEFGTALAYQFNISCEQSVNYTAQENVRRIATIINKYFQEETYRCLDRTGGIVIVPRIEDNNIMTGYLRYACTLVGSQNTIYRRY